MERRRSGLGREQADDTAARRSPRKPEAAGGRSRSWRGRVARTGRAAAGAGAGGADEEQPEVRGAQRRADVVDVEPVEVMAAGGGCGRSNPRARWARAKPAGALRAAAGVVRGGLKPAKAATGEVGRAWAQPAVFGSWCAAEAGDGHGGRSSRRWSLRM